MLKDRSNPPISSRGRSGEERTKPQHDRLISNPYRNCNASGNQWGSSSHFVSADEPQFAATYIEANGYLTIRATYVDPQPWGRKWYSGMVTAASASFRMGCAEMHAKMPAGAGIWPAAWALNMNSMQAGGDPLGQVELDGMEYYGSQPSNLFVVTHDWNDPANGPQTTPPSEVHHGPAKVSTANLALDFHTYDFCVDINNLTTYLDGVQVAQQPLYRATTVDKFWMFDLAMGGGWPITVPASNHYDLQIDYVRIYSAD